MDEADVCRTSSRASRRPLDVISTVAILDPRWRGRKWRHPGPGAVFSTPIVAVAQNGGPSASGRHLGWPHLREPEMRSSKMATGSGRAAILRQISYSSVVFLMKYLVHHDTSNNNTIHIVSILVLFLGRCHICDREILQWKYIFVQILGPKQKYWKSSQGTGTRTREDADR